MVTAAPAAAACSATARPMPELPPTTRTRCFSKDVICCSPLYDNTVPRFRWRDC